VLITGESGTGKELVARSLHAMSQRAGMPMVSLNCPALSPQLMESELFGHERGAFTSADAARVGRFELADGGTILLDEITEIDLGLQAKLLRVLQERTYERVGSSESQQVNVRVLATTNRDLQQFVTEKQFREDLYFRINVLPIQLAPLRERRVDIPQLTQHFLTAAAQRVNRTPLELDSSALDLLYHYAWPGNVRYGVARRIDRRRRCTQSLVNPGRLGEQCRASQSRPICARHEYPRDGTSPH
jgi:transcriptional regulator with GAF, ATPase, and Fis domain